MSSPPPFSPYSQSSNPIFPATSSLPRKRPSTSGTPSNLNPAKRRKPSTSSFVHPLRQSSFPPADGPTSPAGSRVRESYSPSVDGAASATGRSSASARGGKKSKGRSTRAPSTITDNKNNPSRSTPTGARTTAQDENNYKDPSPDNDDDDETAALFSNARENDDIEATADRTNMLMLHAAFSHDQQMRWEEWRKARLDVKAIKRLANQTLSQSVNTNVIQTISAAAKMFVGDVVERAREVQGEWLGSGREREVVGDGVKQEENGNGTGIEATRVEAGEDATNGAMKEAEAEPPYRPLIQERDRGPLTPDHLREAVRRYKKDREGGSAGFVGRSLHGVERTASRTGGKRLFR